MQYARYLTFALSVATLAACADQSTTPNMEDLTPPLRTSVATGTTTQITSRNSGNPKISGNRIVWLDSRNNSTTQRDIYGYDLSTGREAAIVTDPPGLRQWADVGGDWVVWADFGTGTMVLFVKNVVTGEQIQLTNGTVYPSIPSLSGRYVAWHDSRTGRSEVYLYNLITRTETKLTTSRNGGTSPQISGDRVLWSEWPSTNPFFVHNLTSGTTTQLPFDPYAEYRGSGYTTERPVLAGNYVAWLAGPDQPNMYLYAADLRTGAVARLSEQGTWRSGLSSSGDRVVWQDRRSGNEDIYMYDFAVGTETAVAISPANEVGANIDGDRIVWSSNGAITLLKLGSSVPVNRSPVANAGGAYTGQEGVPMQFSGTGSSDPDGDALTYQWSFGDGATGSGATPTHTYANNGVYTATLTVSDGARTATSTAQVTVNNVAPQITMGSGATITPRTSFTLTASFADPGQDSWSCTLNWGDGSDDVQLASCAPGQPIQQSRQYMKPGTYTVTLRVQELDPEAASDTKSVSVVVEPGQPTNPGKPSNPGRPNG